MFPGSEVTGQRVESWSDGRQVTLFFSPFSTGLISTHFSSPFCQCFVSLNHFIVNYFKPNTLQDGPHHVNALGTCHVCFFLHNSVPWSLSSLISEFFLCFFIWIVVKACWALCGKPILQCEPLIAKRLRHGFFLVFDLHKERSDVSPLLAYLDYKNAFFLKDLHF